MASVGLLSSIIVRPLALTFSKWGQSMAENLQCAFLLCLVAVLPMFAVICALVEPIIHVLFERYAFDSAASAPVSSLFFLYALGSTFYIIRELLVMVFYAMGNGKQPFLVSAGAIALNAILDWLFVFKFYLGAQGLALLTSFPTGVSVLILIYLLQKKLVGKYC
ncbi:hypothetical protein NMG60_11026640 [Bertholletia excelsa]